MTRRAFALRGVASLTALMLTLTCEAPDTALPTAPGAPTTTRVEIVGPERLAPGASAQFSALVHLSDGTVKVATPESRTVWRRSSSIVDIDSNGRVTANTVGDVTITVEVPARGQATRELVILPNGTYRLIGVVSDAEIPQLRLPGARIEVSPGSLVTTTDANGVYRLYGVPADAHVTVTAPGYTTIERVLSLAGHAVEDFSMALAGPRTGVQGSYNLSIDFDGGCQSLSLELQHRRYDATVVQQAYRLDVLLTSPEFRIDTAGRGNKFAGTVAGNGVRFDLNGAFFYYYFSYVLGQPDVAELLSDGTLLVPTGVASATLQSDGSLQGTLNGSLTQWTRSGNTYLYRGGCFSSNIRFTLIPR